MYLVLLCLHYLKALINLSLRQAKSIVNTRRKVFQGAVLTAPGADFRIMVRKDYKKNYKKGN